MNKITTTILFLYLSITFSFGQSNFDKGFKEGFKSGYCFSNNQSTYYCNPPLPPLPPLPQINENRNSYQNGYDRGFLFGQARRITDDNNSSNTNVNPNNPPKFNPYVPQSPILSLTPQERAAYYAAKARRDQEAIEALGNALDEIFTVTPEGLARRAERKAKRLEEQYNREVINRTKKEEREKARIIIYGSANYYKLKKSKKIWMYSAIGFSAIGAFSYFQSKNYFNQYQSATTDAENLYNKGEFQKKIYPIAFGLAGLCSLEVILKSVKIKKVDKEHISFNVFPLENGGGIGLTYKF
jgi:hypothetical protein